MILLMLISTEMNIVQNSILSNLIVFFAISCIEGCEPFGNPRTLRYAPSVLLRMHDKC